MSEKSGFLVEYTNTEGCTKKGMVLHIEQDIAFRKQRKYLIILCDDKLIPLRDESDKLVKDLKSYDKVQMTGFID